MQANLKRIATGAAACAVVLGPVTMLFSGSPAYASHLSAGPASIVNPSGGAPLTSGNSNTPFRFKLPADDPSTPLVNEQASCTGDSPNGQYRIQSYLVPQGVDLDTLKFDSNGPVPVAGQFRAPMYMTDSNSYTDQLTAAAVPAGGPGPIIQPLPSFDFAVYDPTGFPLQAGVYNVGIACTLGPPTSSTQLDKYWNAGTITITANPADPGPAKRSFTVNAVPPPNVPEVPRTILLPVGALLLGGGAVLVRRRRTSTTA